LKFILKNVIILFDIKKRFEVEVMSTKKVRVIMLKISSVISNFYN